MTKILRLRHLIVLSIIFEVLFFWSIRAEAHCDSLDGPVIIDARKALQGNNIQPVLKWVKKEYEAEIRDVFSKTLVVREKGEAARDISDRYFFETLVRLHRAGEGAPYTGLKPADSVEPIVALADKALKQESIEELKTKIAQKISDKIQKRFSKALLTKKEKEDRVLKGREYVKSYVEYVHFLEELHGFLTESHEHH